jgi:predicted enzyme related to lactoylglutathione lyase
MSGKLVWLDLTVPDAESVRDFYARVVGWEPQGVDMGGYEDFTMKSRETGEAVAGICFARGPNADVPLGWVPYFDVDDLDAAVERAKGLGAEVVSGPRDGFCLIRDPAGAVAALYRQG